MKQWISELEKLLVLPGSEDGQLCSDVCVLTCGCLASEKQFLEEHEPTCGACQGSPVSILSKLVPMQELYQIVKKIKLADCPNEYTLEEDEEAFQLPDFQARMRPIPRARASSRGSGASEKMNLMSLFYKYAKEEEEEEDKALLIVSTSLEETRLDLEIMGDSRNDSRNDSADASLHIPMGHEAVKTLGLVKATKTMGLSKGPKTMGLDKAANSYGPNTGVHSSKMLDENKERNFSQCFPFHRKVSTYNTQPRKFLFDKGFKLNRFVCTAITRIFDEHNQEKVLFCLVSEKKWELYMHETSRPGLLACGKLTGEYGSRENSMKPPADPGYVVYSDFPSLKGGIDQNDVAARLKSSIYLSCALSEKYLVLSGTRGVLRVLNIDPLQGEIGAPVYTYFTNFPVRCIALAPDSNVLACGITTREKVSGNPQPFIILHHLEKARNSSAVQVSPITITVPFRDPLKLLTFNATSTHLLCCTVYELRYFLISLRSKSSRSYKEPRLVFSETRAPKHYKEKANHDESDDSCPENNEEVEDFMGIEDDDLMLDNEGITDIKFGTPFSNTFIMTSSSFKKRTSIVLKISGYAVDSREGSPPGSESLNSQLYSEVANSLTHTEFYENTSNAEVQVLTKVPEIGSNIYGVASSPRGNGMVFVDKLGRLLLVSTPNAQMNFATNPQTRKTVVLLGEVAPALRSSESASVCFSYDGGKVFAVDRKGVFHVFDFTKGLPRVDPDVLKCKIISI